MTSRLFSVLSTLSIALAGVAVCMPAAAQATFSITAAASGSTCTFAAGTNAGDSLACTGQTNAYNQGTVAPTITAWAYYSALPTVNNTPGSGSFGKARVGDFDGNGLGAYSGANENSTTPSNPQHALDNVITGCSGATDANGGTITLSGANSGCGGSIEALLLDFSSGTGNNKRVNLTGLGVGFTGVDADVAVYRWDGAGAPDQSNTGIGAVGRDSLGNGTITGWSLVSASDLGGSDGNGANPSTFNGGLYSSYFLIATYFGATTSTLDAGNDAFKINALTVTSCNSGTFSGSGNGVTCTTSGGQGVPEPASLALVAAALFGVAASRRRIRRD